MCGHTWLPVGFWVPKNCVCSHSRASTGLGLHPDGFFIFFFHGPKGGFPRLSEHSFGSPDFVISLKLQPPGSLPAAPGTLHPSLEGVWCFLQRPVWGKQNPVLCSSSLDCQGNAASSILSVLQL